jgi:hypothetical protein
MSNILTQVCSTVCGSRNLAYFGMHAGMKFNTQNEEFVNISTRIILPVCLPIHHVL